MELTRRMCVKAFAAAVASGGIGYATRYSSKADLTKLSIPGLYRGKVVAVESDSVLVDGRNQADVVRRMMRRGMGNLTGAGDDWVAAWKHFFAPGDVVGIKVNPTGILVSSREVLLETIAGLNAAGVKNREIVVYDRYRKALLDHGIDKWLPEGVRLSHAAEDYDPIQQAIAGYDSEHYMEMPLVLPGYSLDDPNATRSHASRFITGEVNKLINLPTLKDHQSAGVTLCLKNLSHGLVNNVSRSHADTSHNDCGEFIPAVVAMPVIRSKVVLNVLDGLKALYHAGPGGRPQFVWEHKTLYFGTDPVAIDRIGLRVIDEKRVASGMKPSAQAGPDSFDRFVTKQPEHIDIAGKLGLGESDRAKIEFRKLTV